MRLLILFLIFMWGLIYWLCKQEPVLFLKPTSSYLENGGTIEIPASMEQVWYEAELAVVIGKKARDVSESEALDYVGGQYLFFFFSFI